MNTNLFAILLVCSSIHSLDDTEDDFRKHYGYSYYEHCKEYTKIFKCLSACKSMGFKVFRMNGNCKCTCHDMRVTTVLPFFIWKTTGTPMKPPSTFSPHLYDVVGTLSPKTLTEEENTTLADTTNDAVSDSTNDTTSDSVPKESNNNSGSDVSNATISADETGANSTNINSDANANGTTVPAE